MQDTEALNIPLIVPDDVYDVYGNKIVSAGTEMTGDLLAEIGSSTKFASSCHLTLKGSQLLHDMDRFLQQGVFVEFFSPERRAEILGIYEELKILPVFFEEFAFMRSRDVYVYEHTLRTASLTASLAIDVYGSEKAPLIAYTALTPEFGMTRLPDDILKKGEVQDARLSDLLQGHPIVGHLLLTYYMGGSHFGNCRVALYHHERKNGAGYPAGIHLDDDVVEFITIADAFDALLSPRPYRKEPFDLRSALDLLWVEGKKGMFNPDLVKLLIAYSRKDAGSSEEARIAEEQRIPGPASNRYVNWAAYQLSKKKCLPPGK